MNNCVYINLKGKILNFLSFPIFGNEEICMFSFCFPAYWKLTALASLVNLIVQNQLHYVVSMII